MNQRFKTPVNALLMGAVITVLFCLLVYVNPGSNYHIWFITYPAHVNALVALVSFGVSGIYLSFLLTVIGAIIARARGWQPEGAFRLGRWGVAGLDHRRRSTSARCSSTCLSLGAVECDGRSSTRLDHAARDRDHRRRSARLYLLIWRPDRNIERHLEGGAAPPEAPPVTTA